MTYSGGNILHWLMDPLDKAQLRILDALNNDEWHTPPDQDFEIAYLIARECLDFDKDTTRVRITAKGKDALDLFQGEY